MELGHLSRFIILSLILHTGNQKKLEVTQPSFIKATVGESVNISCSFKTESPSFTVKWTLCCSSQEPFFEHESYKDRVTLSSDFLEVTIINVTEKDSEKYCCKVQTADGESGAGNGTLMNVAPSKEKKDAEKSLSPFILYIIVGLETWIIIILVAVLAKYRLSGSSEQKNKPTVDPEPIEEICYTEVCITQRPRTKRKEEMTTYAPVQLQDVE